MKAEKAAEADQAPRRREFRDGYRAGYALTKDGGKILKEKATPQQRAERIQIAMSTIDKSVNDLAFDYGGNKSEEWKHGCRLGLIDGLKYNKAKY
jgi:hypothetical protein